MAFILRALPLLAGVVSALPFSFPLPNGFPNPSPAALEAIELQGLGTEPNGPPPASLNASTCTALQVVAFNEIHEVAFFTELLSNITNDVPGYDIRDPHARDFAIRAVTAIQAQEELHAININTALTAVCKQAAIQPCQYQYAVSDLESAFRLAATFTDVVIGTLVDLQHLLGTDGDTGLIRVIGAAVGQEGEQDGYFRAVTDRVPSALPFLTPSAAPFAYSAVTQDFVIPGTCPNANLIDVPIFAPLLLDTPGGGVLQPRTQYLQFSFTATAAMGNNLNLVYLNQQNVPVVEKLENPTVANGLTTFEVLFPYEQLEMNGLTIAALTNSAGPFADVDAVAAATVAGPALIEVN